MFALFFFNDTATTEIYTLSLHDALPISGHRAERRWPLDYAADAALGAGSAGREQSANGLGGGRPAGDRKSTRLNSSHSQISYAVFCLKKKKTTISPSPALHNNNFKSRSR